MATLRHWRVWGFVRARTPRPTPGRVRSGARLALRFAGREGGRRSLVRFPEEARSLGAGHGTALRIVQDGRAVWSSGCEHSMETAEDRLSFLLPAFLPSFALSSALLSSVLHYFPTFFFLSLIPPALFSYPPIFYASFFTSFLSFPPSSCPSFFPSFCVLPPPLRRAKGSWQACPPSGKRRISRAASVGIPGSLEAEVAVVAA